MLKTYLERIRQTTDTKTDYAIAKALGIDPTTVLTWNKRGSLPDPATCFAIADLLGEDRAEVIAEIHYHGEKNAKKKARWARVMGKAAALALATSLGYSIGPSTSDASLLTAHPRQSSDSSKEPSKNTEAIDRSINYTRFAKIARWIQSGLAWILYKTAARQAPQSYTFTR